MAKDPFRQLDVIRKVANQNKQVKDCYRLLYQQALWVKAYHQCDFSCAQDDVETLGLIDRMIRQLRTGNASFSQLCQSSRGEQLLFTVIRLILQQIYPRELANSIKTRHQILTEIKRSWGTVTWVSKGVCHQESVQLNQATLLTTMREKIADHRFLNLIGQMIKRKQFKRERALHQLLVAICLLSLDAYVAKKVQIKYVRHQHEYLVGMNMNKDQSRQLQLDIETFLRENVGTELTNCFQHFSKAILYLEYHISKTSSAQQKTHINLQIPKHLQRQFVRKHGYGHLETGEMSPRPEIINHSEQTIIRKYYQELTIMTTYYRLASNYHHLGKLVYFAKGSLLKTIAMKRKSTVTKVSKKMSGDQQLFKWADFSKHPD